MCLVVDECHKATGKADAVQVQGLAQVTEAFFPPPLLQGQLVVLLPLGATQRPRLCIQPLSFPSWVCMPAALHLAKRVVFLIWVTKSIQHCHKESEEAPLRDYSWGMRVAQ